MLCNNNVVTQALLSIYLVNRGKNEILYLDYVRSLWSGLILTNIIKIFSKTFFSSIPKKPHIFEEKIWNVGAYYCGMGFTQSITCEIRSNETLNCQLYLTWHISHPLSVYFLKVAGCHVHFHIAKYQLKIPMYPFQSILFQLYFGALIET
jgi:hypothetical protein